MSAPYHLHTMDAILPPTAGSTAVRPSAVTPCLMIHGKTASTQAVENNKSYLSNRKGLVSKYIIIPHIEDSQLIRIGRHTKYSFFFKLSTETWEVTSLH